MPGDRVSVTGIYRAVPQRPNPKQRNVMSIYKTHVDVVHFRKNDAKRLVANIFYVTLLTLENFRFLIDLNSFH